jgi:hypothetical protein
LTSWKPFSTQPICKAWIAADAPEDYVNGTRLGNSMLGLTVQDIEVGFEEVEVELEEGVFSSLSMLQRSSQVFAWKKSELALVE